MMMIEIGDDDCDAYDNDFNDDLHANNQNNKDKRG